VYNALVAMPCTTNLTGTDLGGLTLTPGVYCFDVAATLTAGNATLTLDAQNGSGVFVFQIGTTLTTGTNSAVNVINGNAATGVFCSSALPRLSAPEPYSRETFSPTRASP